MMGPQQGQVKDLHVPRSGYLEAPICLVVGLRSAVEVNPRLLSK